MSLRHRAWLVMLVCGLALAAHRASRADDPPPVSREELIRKWDLNGDGTIDAADLALLLSNWGNSGVGDIDGDGTAGASDLSALLGAWMS